MAKQRRNKTQNSDTTPQPSSSMESAQIQRQKDIQSMLEPVDSRKQTKLSNKQIKQQARHIAEACRVEELDARLALEETGYDVESAIEHILQGHSGDWQNVGKDKKSKPQPSRTKDGPRGKQGSKAPTAASSKPSRRSGSGQRGGSGRSASRKGSNKGQQPDRRDGRSSRGGDSRHQRQQNKRNKKTSSEQKPVTVAPGKSGGAKEASTQPSKTLWADIASRNLPKKEEIEEEQISEQEQKHKQRQEPKQRQKQHTDTGNKPHKSQRKTKHSPQDQASSSPVESSSSDTHHHANAQVRVSMPPDVADTLVRKSEEHDTEHPAAHNEPLPSQPNDLDATTNTTVTTTRTSAGSGEHRDNGAPVDTHAHVNTNGEGLVLPNSFQVDDKLNLRFGEWGADEGEPTVSEERRAPGPSRDDTTGVGEEQQQPSGQRSGSTASGAAPPAAAAAGGSGSGPEGNRRETPNTNQTTTPASRGNNAANAQYPWPQQYTPEEMGYMPQEMYPPFMYSSSPGGPFPPSDPSARPGQPPQPSPPSQQSNEDRKSPYSHHMQPHPPQPQQQKFMQPSQPTPPYLQYPYTMPYSYPYTMPYSYQGSAFNAAYNMANPSAYPQSTGAPPMSVSPSGSPYGGEDMQQPPTAGTNQQQQQQQQQQQPPQQQQQPGQQKYQQHAFYQYGGMGVMPSGQQPSSQPQGSSDDKNDPGEYGYGPAPPQQPQQQQQQQQQQYPLYHQGGYPPMYMMHPQMYGPTTMQGATTQQHAGQPSTSPHSHGHGHGHGHGKHW